MVIPHFGPRLGSGMMPLDRALRWGFSQLSLFHLLLCVHQAISPPLPLWLTDLDLALVLSKCWGRNLAVTCCWDIIPAAGVTCAEAGGAWRCWGGATEFNQRATYCLPGFLLAQRTMGDKSLSTMPTWGGWSLQFFIHITWCGFSLRQFVQQHVRVSRVGCRLESIQLSSLFLAGLLEWLLCLCSHVVSLRIQGNILIMCIRALDTILLWGHWINLTVKTSVRREIASCITRLANEKQLCLWLKTVIGRGTLKDPWCLCSH